MNNKCNNCDHKDICFFALNGRNVVDCLHYKVKRAEWKINPDGYYPYCSNCKTEPEKLTKYCAECGAEMK